MSGGGGGGAYKRDVMVPIYSQSLDCEIDIVKFPRCLIGYTRKRCFPKRTSHLPI